MWTTIEIEGKSFVLKHTIDKGNCHSVQLTDFITLWCEDINENLLLQRCKELNRLLEASDEDLLANVFSLVESDKNDVLRSFISDETTPTDGRTLCVQSFLDGFKFWMKFYLKPSNSNQFFEKVTQPLLITISELERRQRKLEDELKKKDVEIMEYKLEGARISRRTVETEPFDLQSFYQRCNDEDLSKTKSEIIALPCKVLSSDVQRLMSKIETAPILHVRDQSEKTKSNEQKRTQTKLKSPLKNKKPKICFGDDDDEDTDSEQANIKEKRSIEEKGGSNVAKPSRRKVMPKLLNL